MSGPTGRRWRAWEVRIRLDRAYLSSRSQTVDLRGLTTVAIGIFPMATGKLLI